MCHSCKLEGSQGSFLFLSFYFQLCCLCIGDHQKQAIGNLKPHNLFSIHTIYSHKMLLLFLPAVLIRALSMHYI